VYVEKSMQPLVEFVNGWGEAFAAWAGAMLIQSSLLIGAVMLLDAVLRRRVRAVFRYWLWMLVLAKLVLPPTLASPYSARHWLAGGVDRLAVRLQRASDGAEASEAGYTEPASCGFGAPARDAIAFDEGVLASWGADVSGYTGGGLHDGRGGASMPAVTGIPEKAQEDAGERVRLTGRGILLLLWLVVCGGMAALVVQRMRATGRLVSQSDEPDEALVELLGSCLKRMRMRGGIGIRMASALGTPAMYGILRPVILMPLRVRSQMSRGELEIIIIHELAHIRRGDVSIKLLQTILQVVYFYNPLLWPANAMIRRVREQAVDETVLAVLGASAITDYPRALVQVASMAFGRPGLGLRLIGVVESKGLLTERIRIMLRRPIPKSTKVSVVGAAVLALLAVLLLPMARAEEKAGTSAGDMEKAVKTVISPEGEAARKRKPADHVAATRGRSAAVSERNAADKSVGGEDVRSLELQIVELKRDLEKRMEMLRLLEGKLRVAQLEMRIRDRMTDDPYAAAAMRAPEAPSAPVPPSSVAMGGMGGGIHGGFGYGGGAHGEGGGGGGGGAVYGIAAPGVSPPVTATPGVPHVIPRGSGDVSSEVREAVKEVLPQMLEKMLPKLIEEVLVRMEQKASR